MIGLIAQWLERVNGKHEVEDFNPTWANFLYRIKNLSSKGISYVIIETDLYVKPTDSHKYLQSSSCRPFYCKKGIAYSQTLRLNLICSETNSFDKLCNDLERGYSSNLVRKEILRARKITRNELLDKEKGQGNDSKLTFNVTYYPVFRHLKSQLKELHVILACDEDHKKVFPEVPIIKITCGESRSPRY